MTEKYLIVFGDHPEQQIKPHRGKFKSYKEAPWLYDGFLYQDGELSQEIVSIIFRDPTFAPSAVIDNGKWLSPQLFGNNQQIWREALAQCFALTTRDRIRCFSYVD
jgi:hypothetical protein